MKGGGGNGLEEMGRNRIVAVLTGFVLKGEGSGNRLKEMGRNGIFCRIVWVGNEREGSE